MTTKITGVGCFEEHDMVKRVIRMRERTVVTSVMPPMKRRLIRSGRSILSKTTAADGSDEGRANIIPMVTWLQRSADGSSWLVTAFHGLELGRFDNQDAARNAVTLLRRHVR